jgi:hypothetical protein
MITATATGTYGVSLLYEVPTSKKKIVIHSGPWASYLGVIYEEAGINNS